MASYRCPADTEVSIPTRPEGRVQDLDAAGRVVRGRVSILTRLSGRVQADRQHGQPAAKVFQSSPVSQDGCKSVGPGAPVKSSACQFQSSPVSQDGCKNQPADKAWSSRGWFQSSPVSQDGCKCRRRPRPAARPTPSRFNPHPSLRTGASSDAGGPRSLPPCFNPHPSLRTGASRSGCGGSSSARLFQSSPVSQDGCKISVAHG